MHEASERWRPWGLIAAALSSASAAATQPAAPVPWAVAASPAIDHRVMAFASGDVRLSGTLYFVHGSRPMPAVVALHGAGMPSQNDRLYDHLKQMLPRLGMAVFVFDRRGSGASGGNDARKTDFDVLAGDGVAAWRMLAADRLIDPHRIGFWGLSQGGWLTVLAAAKEPRAAFAIAVSAPMADAGVQMNYAAANIMRINGYGQADIDEAIAARRAVDAYALGKRDRASAQRALDAARAKPWYKLIYLEGNIDDPTWRGQITADPLHALDVSRIPTLMIYGQVDPWVPVGASLEALAASARRHPNVTTTVIDGADHMMMLGVDPKRQIDPDAFASEAPDAPAYFATVATWLAKRRIIAVQPR